MIPNRHFIPDRMFQSGIKSGMNSIRNEFATQLVEKLLLTVEKCTRWSGISLLCTIVEKNVNDSRDFSPLSLVSDECTEKPSNMAETIVRCRVIVVYGTLWHAKLGKTITMAADVDELVDFFFVFLIVCFSQCQRFSMQSRSIGIGNIARTKWKTTFLS